MERLIIQGIQRLRVLTPCDYANMDELVHDLSNALEESSRSTGARSRRGKCWKRRPRPPPSYISLGSSAPKSSPVSEDSESSLDDRMRCRMEINVVQSDSDEMLTKNKNHLLSWRQCVASLVESDSVNENFLPSHPHRRKRKFKRMAVDPQQPGSPGMGITSCLDMPSPNKPGPISVSPKSRKVKSIRAMKSKGKQSRFISMDIENICGPDHKCENGQNRESGSVGELLCGKRKRSMRERSLECARSENPTISVETFLRPDSAQQGSPTKLKHSFMDCDGMLHDASKCPFEASSSSLSSSESDGGLFTNDEGREADDEHSDFFHEAGPACGIPGVVNPWWEDESGEMSSLCFDAELLDPELKAILSNSMQHASQGVQDTYHASISRLMDQASREIRAGRRRLGKMRPSPSVWLSANEKMSKFVQDQITTANAAQAVSVDAVISKSTISDIKRRRRMPPNGTPIPAFSLTESGATAPDSNLGNLMRNISREPGTCLGREVPLPLAACLRAKYQGLGFLLPPPKCTSNNVPQDEETVPQASTSTVCNKDLDHLTPLSLCPPPPPPSPQPPTSRCIATKTDTKKISGSIF